MTAFSVGGGPPAPGPRVTPPVEMYSVEHAITTGQIPVGGTARGPRARAHRLVAASVNPPHDPPCRPAGPPGHDRRDDGAAAAVPARDRLQPCGHPGRGLRGARPRPARPGGWTSRPGPPRDGGPGLQLLQQAAQAGARVSYQGVEMVSGVGRDRRHHGDRERLAPQRGRHAGPGGRGRGRGGQPGPAGKRVRRHRQPGPRGRARGHRRSWSRCWRPTTTWPTWARVRRTAGPRGWSRRGARTARWRRGSGWTR